MNEKEQQQFDHTYFDEEYYKRHIESLESQINDINEDLRNHWNYLMSFYKGYMDYIAQGKPND